jgi:hypothetical protein
MYIMKRYFHYECCNLNVTYLENYTVTGMDSCIVYVPLPYQAFYSYAVGYNGGFTTISYVSNVKKLHIFQLWSL